MAGDPFQVFLAALLQDAATAQGSAAGKERKESN